VYGRAYGFERAMDNLGAIAGPLLALVLVGLAGVRTAIALSVAPWPSSTPSATPPEPRNGSGNRCGCASGRC
jgi:hypothetical protein